MNKINSKKGFTLIEVMVATSIFMIVMLAAMGGLLTASASAKKARALRIAMDNVNYAMDSMSRTIRLGSNYNCSSGTPNYPSAITNQDCSSGNTLVFQPASVGTSVHTEQDTAFLKNTLNNKNTVQKCNKDNNTCINITAPEVDITDLRFTVRGSGSTDSIQPSVFILMKGTVTINGEVTDFALQTLASQRNAE